jgi:hypothetical protein
VGWQQMSCHFSVKATDEPTKKINKDINSLNSEDLTRFKNQRDIYIILWWWYFDLNAWTHVNVPVVYVAYGFSMAAYGDFHSRKTDCWNLLRWGNRYPWVHSFIHICLFYTHLPLSQSLGWASLLIISQMIQRIACMNNTCLFSSELASSVLFTPLSLSLSLSLTKVEGSYADHTHTRTHTHKAH